VGSGDPPTDIWKFASEQLLYRTYSMFKKVEKFRYFIVGNCIDGYAGIERDLSAEIDTEEVGRAIWKYEVMDAEACRKQVTKRQYSN